MTLPGRQPPRVEPGPTCWPRPFIEICPSRGTECAFTPTVAASAYREGELPMRRREFLKTMTVAAGVSAASEGLPSGPGTGATAAEPGTADELPRPEETV